MLNLDPWTETGEGEQLAERKPYLFFSLIKKWSFTYHVMQTALVSKAK